MDHRVKPGGDDGRIGAVRCYPPPRSETERGRGTTRSVVEGARGAEAGREANAPSTALRAVPLPRFAGQEEEKRARVARTSTLPARRRDFINARPSRAVESANARGEHLGESYDPAVHRADVMERHHRRCSLGRLRGQRGAAAERAELLPESGAPGHDGGCRGRRLDDFGLSQQQRARRGHRRSRTDAHGERAGDGHGVARQDGSRYRPAVPRSGTQFALLQRYRGGEYFRRLSHAGRGVFRLARFTAAPRQYAQKRGLAAWHRRRLCAQLQI